MKPETDTATLLAAIADELASVHDEHRRRLLGAARTWPTARVRLRTRAYLLQELGALIDTLARGRFGLNPPEGLLAMTIDDIEAPERQRLAAEPAIAGDPNGEFVLRLTRTQVQALATQLRVPVEITALAVEALRNEACAIGGAS